MLGGANDKGTFVLNNDSIVAGVETVGLLPINGVGSLLIAFGTRGSGNFIVGNNKSLFGGLEAADCASENMLGVGPPAPEDGSVPTETP